MGFFSKCAEVIRKHPVIVVLIIIIMVIGIPILINCLFKLSAPFDLFAAEWTADSALTYYGSVLTFLGTFVLSVLALWQNHVIEEVNSKHTALLERMEREKNAPFIIISDVVGHGNASDLTFFVKNISENIAKEISISNFIVVNKEGTTRWKSDKIYQIPYLSYLSSEKIHLHNPAILDSAECICFCITFYDKFDEMHKCEVIGQFTDNVTIPHFKIKEMHN